LNPQPQPSHANRSERLLQSGILSLVGFAVVLAVTAILANRSVVGSLTAVAFDDATRLIAVQNLRIAAGMWGRKARRFLLTGDERALDGVSAARGQFARHLQKLEAAKDLDDEARDLVERIDLAQLEYEAQLERAVRARRDPSSARDALTSLVELEVQPARDEVDGAINDLASLDERRLADATADAKGRVALSLKVLVALAGCAMAIAIALGMLLLRAVSELGKQRQQSTRHLQRVEELNVDLDAFAGRVSHDLRNLLNPIALAPTLLRSAADRPQAVIGVADKIQRATVRSLALLDGLLAFSRSGHPDPCASASVASVVDDVLEQLGWLVTQVDAQVERDVADAAVACSPDLLNVVLLNLLGNALKFMRGSSVRVVTIGARAAGASYELCVCDTGPGIPEEEIAYVFQPFYRASGTTAPGTGIGLATVRRIVEAHGGTVSVQSASARGTTFRVHLPLSHDPPTELDAPAPARGKSAGGRA
jgi:two-component system OmpR family sensor kinase